MIIPPDPEKDANVFSPSSSTPSLIPPPSENADTDDSSSITHPPAAHTRNPTFGYPFGDDLGVGYDGEALPPYRRDRDRDSDTNVNVFDDPAPIPPLMRERERHRRITPSTTITIPSNSGSHADFTPRSPEDLTPIASTSTANLPYTSLDTPSSTMVSTSKLWESSTTELRTSSKGKGKKRAGLLPPVTLSQKWRKWWKRWRKWVYIILGLLLAGLGLMIGLLVGIKTGAKEDQNVNNGPPWKDTSEDGKRQNWVAHGESLNITYIPQRDGPGNTDGTLINCPAFSPLNASSPITLLSRPFPGQTASVAKFEFPLSWNNGSNSFTFPEFTFIARGLGSSGTIEFVGVDSPAAVITSGKEGVVSVDVVALYAGQQSLSDIVKVCELQRDDDGRGLGIYTPQETDGKVTNAYMVNPLYLPSFHIVVRLPPSVLNRSSPGVAFPQLSFFLDRTAVRFGNLLNVIEFGHVNVTSQRGGVSSGYIAAERIHVNSSENAVRGLYNVSQSLSVNNIEGSIFADVILFDSGKSNSTTDQPQQASSNSTEFPYSLEQKRGWHAQSSSASPTPTYENNAASASPTTLSVKPTHSISTSFTTGEGIVSVSYINHPPSVALSAFIATGQGDMSVGLHPNYVGPFVIKDVWGQVRIPQPHPLYDRDPRNWGRKRDLAYGLINIVEGGLYDRQGLNDTVLNNSPLAISGAAYWQGDDGITKSDKVQALEESGGEVLILGSWGDIRFSVDGT